MMKVYWSEEAARRLREIAEYIAKDSPMAAQQVVERLLQRSRLLSTPVPLGRRLPEFPDSALREVLERPYRLIYTATEHGLEIVTVMHYRQLLPSRVEDLSSP